MEGVVAQRIRMELRVSPGTNSMVVRVISVMVAALPRPAITEHLAEAKADLVAMEDPLDLVETEMGHFPALMEPQVDLKAGLDAAVEVEHLPLFMVLLTANKLVLVVQLMEGE
jgi:hypothetical protein